MKRPCPLSLSLLYVRESRLWASQRVALEPVPPRPPLPLSFAFSKKAARPFPLLLLLLRFDEGSRKDRAAKDVGEPLHAGRGNVRSTFRKLTFAHRDCAPVDLSGAASRESSAGAQSRSCPSGRCALRNRARCRRARVRAPLRPQLLLSVDGSPSPSAVPAHCARSLTACPVELDSSCSVGCGRTGRNHSAFARRLAWTGQSRARESRRGRPPTPPSSTSLPLHPLHHPLRALHCTPS